MLASGDLFTVGEGAGAYVRFLCLKCGNEFQRDLAWDEKHKDTYLMYPYFHLKKWWFKRGEKKCPHCGQKFGSMTLPIGYAAPEKGSEKDE